MVLPCRDLRGTATGNRSTRPLSEVDPGVLIYVRKPVTTISRITTICPGNTPCFLGINVTTETFRFRLFSFYHRVPTTGPGLALDPLFYYEDDPHIPTLIGDDFNTHSPSWSDDGTQVSPWATVLED